MTNKRLRGCYWEVLLREETSCQPPNKRLQRTVTRRHVRAASASLHYAPAARITRQRAAAEPQRYTAQHRRRDIEPASNRAHVHVKT